jgi:sialic acid synthase SpsE
MRNRICVGNKVIGEQNPVFIIAEIGINHNFKKELRNYVCRVTNGKSKGTHRGEE